MVGLQLLDGCAALFASSDCGIPLRRAAYELGIERVVEASRTRGYIS